MKISTKQLSNKLKVLSVFDKDSQSVTIMALVRVGSRFEVDSQAGLAHFVEHTFFKGTKNRATSKIIGTEIESMGGNTNAFTSHDYTGYFIKVPKEKFKNAAEILSDMINNALFDEKEIEKERGVIIEEIRMYEDMPRSKAAEVFTEKLYGKHPLGRLITGSVKTVTDMKRSDFLEFVKENYVGENMMVVAAGGVENDIVETELSKLFGDLPAGKFADYKKFEGRKVEAEVVIQNKAVEQTHLVLGGLGMNRKDKDRFALQVGNAVLSEGFGSKLFQVIRDELGLAYYIYSGLDMLDETGSYGVMMGVDNKRAGLAVSAVIEELKKLKKGDFDNSELDRARNFLVGNLVTELETTDDLAHWHASQELLVGEVLTIDEVKGKLLSVTRDDIVKVWSKILSPDNFLVAGISPLKGLEDELKSILATSLSSL